MLNLWSTISDTLAWLCTHCLICFEAKTWLLIIHVLWDRKRKPSSSFVRVTSRRRSCSIRLLALVYLASALLCLHLSCRISARNLHDAGVREAIRRRQLPSHPPICTEKQAKACSCPLTSPHWQTKTENTAGRKKNPWDFTLYLSHVSFCLLRYLVSFFQVEPFPGLVFSFNTPSVLTLS